MRKSHITRRKFVKVAAVAGGTAAMGGLVACAPDSGASSASSQAKSSADVSALEDSASSAVAQDAASSEDTGAAANEAMDQEGTMEETETTEPTGNAPAVYFVRAVNPEALQAVFDALGSGIAGSHIGVKLSSGEPGGNHFLAPDLIAGLVSSVGGTIVECNTAYGGGRSSTENHYHVADDHGFTSIADFQIMDEDGSYLLPVEGGLQLTENLVGAHFPDYDGFLVLSHFKGHAMAGFGGALKNLSIGMASSEGKCLIHTGGASSTSWMGGSQDAFQEAMADACKACLAAQPNMLFVNVMNNLSVDCDCDSNPAPPKMADIGVLASADPVALDQACVDLIYASDDNSADLIQRMESRNGEHTLEAAEQLGIGSRTYELVEIG